MNIMLACRPTQPMEDQATLNADKPNERNLHIGGSIAHAGWKVFNAIVGGHVDQVGNANDLSRFDDNTFSRAYASHVVEHLDYTAELTLTLNEWKRVLPPGGAILLSVPDLDFWPHSFSKKSA
jgi:predicted SAM-dependent methyltransferase